MSLVAFLVPLVCDDQGAELGSEAEQYHGYEAVRALRMYVRHFNMR